jgi:hypothetical protein
MQSMITYEIAGEGPSILAIVAFAMHPGRVRGAVTPAQNPPT